MTHVPYKGGGQAMPDLMAGHVDILFAPVLESSSHIKSGKLKGLALTHARRSPALPDVPPPAEAAVQDAESGSWIALVAPAGTTAAIRPKGGAAIRKIDLVLLDLQLENSSGVHTLNKFRSAAPAIPVLVVAAAEDRDTIHACLKAGARGYVPKTAALKTLRAALETIAAGGLHIPLEAGLPLKPAANRN